MRLHKNPRVRAESWDVDDPAFRHLVEQVMTQTEEDEYFSRYGSRKQRKAAKERIEARKKAKKSGRR